MHDVYQIVAVSADRSLKRSRRGRCRLSDWLIAAKTSAPNYGWLNCEVCFTKWCKQVSITCCREPTTATLLSCRFMSAIVLTTHDLIHSSACMQIGRNWVIGCMHCVCTVCCSLFSILSRTCLTVQLSFVISSVIAPWLVWVFCNLAFHEIRQL